MMKKFPKVYVASRFNKTFDNNGTMHFPNDIRVKMLKDESLMTFPTSNTYIKDKYGNNIFKYIGPFYNESASNGDFTSTICEEVVNSEVKLIDKCDVLVLYFDDIDSPGTVSELIYAATKNKKIIIFYKTNDNVIYSVKTDNWYPIVLAKQLATNVTIVPVNNDIDILNYFNI